MLLIAFVIAFAIVAYFAYRDKSGARVSLAQGQQPRQKAAFSLSLRTCGAEAIRHPKARPATARPNVGGRLALMSRKLGRGNRTLAGQDTPDDHAIELRMPAALSRVIC